MLQTIAEDDVRRVGSRLACKCGCIDSVATCSMLECHFSKPAKEKIAQMQTAGMADDQIIQSFIREYGEGIYLAHPNAFGWIVPYSTVAVGLVMIWLFIKKYRKPKPLTDLGAIEIVAVTPSQATAKPRGRMLGNIMAGDQVAPNIKRR